MTILNLPSPPGMDVERDFAGSFGTATPVRRAHYGHSHDVVFPVFMPYLATAVTRQGWSVRIVDGQAQRLTADAVVSSIVEQQPDFIVSLVSLPSVYGDLSLLGRIKRTLPDCIVVIVGAVAKTLASEVVQKETVDILAVGEYPRYAEPVIELARAWLAARCRSAGWSHLRHRTAPASTILTSISIVPSRSTSTAAHTSGLAASWWTIFPSCPARGVLLRVATVRIPSASGRRSRTSPRNDSWTR